MVEFDNALANESWVVFQDADLVETRALLRRFDRHTVAFEHYTLDAALRVSQVLSNFKIICRGTAVYSGRVLIRSLINSGATVLCEATLDDAWIDITALAGGNAGGLMERYREFFQKHERFHLISPEYTAAVAGLRNYLEDVRLWLDHVGLGLPEVESRERSQIERQTAWAIRDPIVETIRTLFERFEETAAKIPENLEAAYFAYGQRQVRPLLLDAPFVFRTFRKPLGYAGDYMMVAMMFGDPCVGPSLFARVLNCYSLDLPPILAHRNRIGYLLGQLEKETLRAMRHRRQARIFNLGCGPAREVQTFLERSAAADEARFTLVDFNQETLNDTRRDIDRLCAKHGRRTEAEFVRKSVQQLLKESARNRVAGTTPQYDFVYCAGLFDYLSDNVCKLLVEILWGMVAPGGLLIVTNVDRHSSRAQMECFLEWNLVYRDSQGMRRLAPGSVPSEDVVLKRDETGVNIFLELRKPEHGH
jgi:extracellular factor (EF) 3-hydroxypalmitic acid methyl ester biosynthesis protein